jgi:hypothetical protein
MSDVFDDVINRQASPGVLRPSHRARRRDGDAVRRCQASRDTGVKKPARRGISGTGKSPKCTIKCSGLSRELSGQNSSSGAPPSGVRAMFKRGFGRVCAPVPHGYDRTWCISWSSARNRSGQA